MSRSRWRLKLHCSVKPAGIRGGMVGTPRVRFSVFVFGATPNSANPLRRDALSRRWAAARGKSSMTLLDLRHYVATAMLDAGESYRTVADVPGNSEATLRLHHDGRTGIEKRKAVSALEP